MHEHTENPDGYLDANPQWEPEVSDMLTHDEELSRIAGWNQTTSNMHKHDMKSIMQVVSKTMSVHTCIKEVR